MFWGQQELYNFAYVNKSTFRRTSSTDIGEVKHLCTIHRSRNKSNDLELHLQLHSVWSDGSTICSRWGHLQHHKFASNHWKYTRVCSKYCQILSKTSKNGQRQLKICPSGEISPNRVTLGYYELIKSNLGNVLDVQFVI